MKGVWLITICKFETNLLVLHKGQTRIVFDQICLHTSYLREFIKHAVWNHPSLHKNWISTFFKERIAQIWKPQQLSCFPTSPVLCSDSAWEGGSGSLHVPQYHDLLLLSVTMSRQYISLCPSFSALSCKASAFWLTLYTGRSLFPSLHIVLHFIRKITESFVRLISCLHFTRAGLYVLSCTLQTLKNQPHHKWFSHD